MRFPRDMYTADEEFTPSRRLIRDLLEPNVLKRLGCLKRGMLDIKDAPFFHGVSTHCFHHPLPRDGRHCVWP